MTEDINNESASSTKETSQGDRNIRILLIGATGTGKSASGNTILSQSGGDKEVFFHVGFTSDPKTRETEEITRDILKRKITLVDTAGADNIVDDPVEVQRGIRDAVSMSEGYDVIIFVLSVLENRLELNDIDLKAIEVIETILGKEFWDHGIFLFTHGDNYEKMHNQKKKLDGQNYALLDFEEFVKKNRLARNRFAIGPQAVKADFVAVKFENSEDDSSKRTEMVTKLLKKVDAIVKRNDGKMYTKDSLPVEKLVLPKYQWINKTVRVLKPYWHTFKETMDFPNIIIAILVLILAVLVMYVIMK